MPSVHGEPCGNVCAHVKGGEPGATPNEPRFDTGGQYPRLLVARLRGCKLDEWRVLETTVCTVGLNKHTLDLMDVIRLKTSALTRTPYRLDRI